MEQGKVPGALVYCLLHCALWSPSAPVVVPEVDAPAVDGAGKGRRCFGVLLPALCTLLTVCTRYQKQMHQMWMEESATGRSLRCFGVLLTVKCTLSQPHHLVRIHPADGRTTRPLLKMTQRCK